MRVLSVNAGRPRLVMHRGKRYSTAINKQPLDGPVSVDTDGIAEDRQADGRFHGGPEKALCVYPHEHYAYFERKLGRSLALPSFGENLTTEGWLEATARVGDRMKIGEHVVVEVVQPRTPCVKLARLHDEPAIVRWVKQTAYCGFYLRVIEGGPITTADPITMLKQGDGPTIADLLRHG